MIDSMEWLRAFIIHYPVLQYLVIFFGAAFGGEVAMIFFAFLAAQKIFPFPPFLIIAFVAVICSDSLWFFLGRTKLISKITDHRYATNTVSIIIKAIHKMSRGHHGLALLFAKFIIGTRVVFIFYLSKTNIAFKNFMAYDLLAIFMWFSVIIPIGFLSGLGFTYISNILENIYAGIGFLLLILLIIIIIQIWFKKILTKKGQEMEEDTVL